MTTQTRKRAAQDRAEITKEKLLAATLSVILRDGWSGTSTLKVCQEAGVSNGAQTHHYPKKNDLLVAALKRNRDALRARTEAQLKKQGKEKLPLREHLELLDLTKQDEPYFYATLESLIAARTDETLRDDIRAIDEEWIETLRSTSEARIEEIPGEHQAEDLMELTLYLVRGLVVQRGIANDSKHLDRMFSLWCDLVERAVG